jgi:hypothetical protein
MFTESSTDAIKCHRICTTVSERQAESNHPQYVPKVVIIFLGMWTEWRKDEKEDEKCANIKKRILKTLVTSRKTTKPKVINFNRKSREGESTRETFFCWQNG